MTTEKGMMTILLAALACNHRNLSLDIQFRSTGVTENFSNCLLMYSSKWFINTWAIYYKARYLPAAITQYLVVTKRSHILKQTCSFQVLNMYDPFVPTRY